MISKTLNTGVFGNLTVTLDGGAKLAHSNREGHYIMNGKQYWIQDQGSNAIWYDKDSWNIGDKEHLGTSNCSLYSTKNTKRPEEATTWMYAKNGGWLPTSNIFGSLSMY